MAYARSLAAAQLTRWGLDELVFATEITVSKLVTNACWLTWTLRPSSGTPLSASTTAW
ncbi:hypothetical protein ACWEQ1_34040 [Streptomyces nodosus]